MARGRYADTAQVMYDTLESMAYLGEMNTDNLKKMTLTLPKLAQAKIHKHLKNLESQGCVMPTFQDVVDFLNGRADVANHPLFLSPVSEMKTPNSKTLTLKFTSLVTTEGATNQSENGNAVKYDKKLETARCVAGHIPSIYVGLSNQSLEMKEMSFSRGAAFS